MSHKLEIKTIYNIQAGTNFTLRLVRVRLKIYLLRLR